MYETQKTQVSDIYRVETGKADTDPSPSLGVFQKLFSFQTMSSDPAPSALGRRILLCLDLLNYTCFASKTASYSQNNSLFEVFSLTAGRVCPDPRYFLALPNLPQGRKSFCPIVASCNIHQKSATIWN